MDPLPIARSTCTLDDRQLREQLERYREVGERATLLELGPRRLGVRFDDRVASERVAQVVEIERGCCPFFDFAWSDADRRLEISVASSDQEPALRALAVALGVVDRSP